MTILEKLTKEIMAECAKDGEPITYKEAEEMAKMEIGSAKIKRYEKADSPKEKKPREKKVDADKVDLITFIRNSLNLKTTSSGGLTKLEITNEQKEITFSYKGAEYSVTLTKHRPKKV